MERSIVNKQRFLKIAVLAGLILLVAVFIRAVLPQTSSASAITRAAPPALVLTEHDNFATKHIKQGQLVQIHFAKWSGMAWDQPHDSASLLTPQGAIGVQPGNGNGSSWEFVASRTGTTTIASSASPVCKMGQPCPQLFFSWHVTIVVTP